MRCFNNLLIFTSLIVFNSCDKSNSNNVTIKQLKIDIIPGNNGTQYDANTVKGRTFESSNIYMDFNKNNYMNCKSIIFVGSITANIDPQSMNYSDTCYLDLFDLTDTIIIPHSTLKTSSIMLKWIESDNLLNNFPDKNINLTVRLRSWKNGLWVGLNSASLYINF